MDGIYMLTAANVLRLEEKPFEIPRGIILFSPLFSATFFPPIIPFLPVSPALLSPLTLKSPNYIPSAICWHY
jgi:hypothetical protein